MDKTKQTDNERTESNRIDQSAVYIAIAAARCRRRRAKRESQKKLKIRFVN